LPNPKSEKFEKKETYGERRVERNRGREFGASEDAIAERVP